MFFLKSKQSLIWITSILHPIAYNIKKHLKCIIKKLKSNAKAAGCFTVKKAI